MNVHPKAERALAIIEFIMTTMMAIIVISAFRDIYSSRSQEFADREWAPLVISVFMPLFVTFAVAALAMWYQVKYRWRIQTLPIIVLIGMLWFLIT